MADDTILFETLSKVLVHAQDIILSTVFDHARRPPTVASLMAPSSSSKGGNASRADETFITDYLHAHGSVRLSPEEEQAMRSREVMERFRRRLTELVDKFVWITVMRARDQLENFVETNREKMVASIRDDKSVLKELHELRRHKAQMSELVKLKDRTIQELTIKLSGKKSNLDNIRETLFKEVTVLREQLHAKATSTKNVVRTDMNSFSYFDWMALMDEETADDERRFLMMKLHDVVYGSYMEMRNMYDDKIRGLERRLSQLQTRFKKMYEEITKQIMFNRERDVPLPFDRTLGKDDAKNAGDADKFDKDKRRMRRLKTFLSGAAKEQENMQKKLIVLAKRIDYYERSGKTAGHLNPAMEARAPDGDIYMVFTDVEGSTSLWEAMPDVIERCINIQLNMLRKNCDRYLGYEVKSEGDGYFCTFADPFMAANFCMQTQLDLHTYEWPSVILTNEKCMKVYDKNKNLIFCGLRVRMGIHKGNPRRVKDEISGRYDYFGKSVNRAARVAGAAHGGQTILSSEIWDEVKHFLHKIVGEPVWRDRGSHIFKGLDTPELCIEVLPKSLAGRSDLFPAIASTSAKPAGDIKEELKLQLHALESAAMQAGATPLGTARSTVDNLDDAVELAIEEYKTKIHAEFAEKELQLEEKMKSVRKILTHLLACLDERDLLHMQAQSDSTMHAQLRGCEARLVRLRRDVERVFQLQSQNEVPRAGTNAGNLQSNSSFAGGASPGMSNLTPKSSNAHLPISKDPQAGFSPAFGTRTTSMFMNPSQKTGATLQPRQGMAREPSFAESIGDSDAGSFYAGNRVRQAAGQLKREGTVLSQVIRGAVDGMQVGISKEDLPPPRAQSQQGYRSGAKPPQAGLPSAIKR